MKNIINLNYKEPKRKCIICGRVQWESDFYFDIDVCTDCADELDYDNPFCFGDYNEND